VFETTPKMPAKNYFTDIMGINLEYALEAYDWITHYPIIPLFQHSIIPIVSEAN